MTQLSLTLPEIGKPDKTEDVKLNTALTQIQTWGNGNIDEANLSSSLRSSLLLPTTEYQATKVIATEEVRSSTSFGTLTEADQVKVTIPEGFQLAVSYMATWRESVVGAARAAIFIAGNQLKAASTLGVAPVVQEASIGKTSGTNALLTSMTAGLSGSEAQATAYPGNVTTGQVIGVSTELARYGFCFIDIPAGTYAVSVQFKSSSGTVTVLNRKLRARAF